MADPTHAPKAAEELARTVPASLMRQARAIRLAEGERLFRVGDKVREAFFTLSGEVRLARIGLQGTEITLQRSRGGFIAEASLYSKAYHCDAIASCASDLVAFQAAAFKAALEQDPAFSKRWQSILAKEVRKLRAQCERLCLRTAEERIVHYIEAEGAEGTIELPMTKKAWATDLGLTHEALYRAVKRLQESGVLRVEGRQLALQASPTLPQGR